MYKLPVLGVTLHRQDIEAQKIHLQEEVKQCQDPDKKGDSGKDDKIYFLTKLI